MCWGGSYVRNVGEGGAGGGVTLQSLAAKVSIASDFANIGRKIEWVSSWRKNIAKFSKRLAETGYVSYHQGWEYAK